MTDNDLMYETSGGAVRVGKGFYVERPEDEKFIAALLKARDVFVITAPRQTGKSSLWSKAQHELKNNGFHVGTVDFRSTFGQPEESNRTSAGWTAALLRAFARAFKQDPRLVKPWIKEQDNVSAIELIQRYITEILRPKFDGPMVIAIDEIDVVQLYHYFTDNLFEAIRSLAQERDELDLSFVLIGMNHPRDLLTTSAPASFNILGEGIELSDFAATPENADAWSKGLAIDDEATRIQIGLKILEITGGQPYLTACVFGIAQKEKVQTIAATEDLLKRLMVEARDEGWISAHFDNAKDIIIEQPNRAYMVLEQYQKIFENPVPLRSVRPDIRATLLSSGLVREVKKTIDVKSPFYRAYFDEAWISDVKSLVGNKAYDGDEIINITSEKKPRICIINTGGMISMELQPDGKTGQPHDLGKFFRQFPELHTIAEIDSVTIFSKDSSDMNPDDWKLIAEAIYNRRAEGYQGFVVVGGTDTLPHTASAVAFALGDGLTFPVVFVGSQLAPHKVYGDARINLMRAATVATEGKPEVMAVVGDTIHRAVRVQKKDDYRFDGMYSPTLEPLGVVSNEVVWKEPMIRSVKKIAEIDLMNEFSSGVFKIGLYPGLNPEFIMPILNEPTLEGIIIETFGIGNVPTGEPWSLIPFIAGATERNIPVMLASQFPVQPNMLETYEPAQAPLDAGAFTSGDMSPPAAVTKFMWVLPQITRRLDNGSLKLEHKLAQVEEWMKTDLIGEMSEQNKSGEK